MFVVNPEDLFNLFQCVMPIVVFFTRSFSILPTHTHPHTFSMDNPCATVIQQQYHKREEHKNSRNNKEMDPKVHSQQHVNRLPYENKTQPTANANRPSPRRKA